MYIHLAFAIIRSVRRQETLGRGSYAAKGGVFPIQRIDTLQFRMSQEPLHPACVNSQSKQSNSYEVSESDAVSVFVSIGLFLMLSKKLP